MKNMATNQKLILLMLITAFLMCWVQGVSHGGSVVGGVGEALGAAGTAVGLAVGAAGTALGVAAGAVLIAVGVVDLSVRLIATVVWHTDSLSSMTIFPNGGIIGVVVSNLIHLGDPHAVSPHTTLTYDSPINSIAFNPNNSLLASASVDSTIQLWNLNTNTLQATLRGHTSNVLSVAFDPNGALLASGSADGTVRLWNPITETLEATVQGHTGDVLSVAFSPDGLLLASGSADGTVRLWNLVTETLEATLEAHMDSVLSVAFSPDGSLLASGSADGLVGLWDTHTEILQATLGHESPVLSVAFSPDSDLLATGSTDGTARLWDPHVPEHKATLGHESPVESVAFDGNTLVTGSQDGRVRQWELTTLTAPPSSSQESEAPRGSESQPEGVTASTAAPLTEATLDESVVTLTLSGGTYEDSSYTVGRAITVSGIDGVTFKSYDVDRVSDTEVTVELTFNGDFDTNATLTFTVGADAIANYSGSAFTAQVPVTSGSESLVASTTAPLTEATLDGSIVTLTLSGRAYEGSSYTVGRAITISGIDGVTFKSYDVDRISDTEVTVELTFSGDFDTNATLTFTVEAGAIAGYGGSAFTAQIPVTSGSESLVASTTAPLTEATLDGSVVTLTLSGRTYERSSFRIRDAVTVSGISGVTVGTFDIDRVSDTQVTVELMFDGTDFDTTSTLTFTVGPGAIAGYDGPALTAQVPVSATTEAPTVTDPQPPQQLDTTDSRVTFESSTPAGYTRVTLRNTGAVWGVPTQYTTDSDAGTVAYMLLATLKGCSFADAEVARQSKVYIKTQALGSLSNFESETVCSKTSRTWTTSWNGVRITHLRFFEESSTPNIKEAVYNDATGHIEIPGDSVQIPTPTPTNNAPTFTAGSTTTRTIAENAAANVNIGSPVSATDADNDTLTYTLGGTDANAFSIVRTSGQLRTRAALDYETKRSYTVTITVSDGSLSDTITVTINITDISEVSTTTVGQPEVCQVGDVLAPGESCTYPGTDTEFSVLNDGRGQFGFFTSGNNLNIKNTVINGQSYTLVAEKLANGSWKIEELGDDSNQQPETPEQPEQPGDTGGTPTLTASTTSPLTEATLDESIVTLTLSGGTYESSSSRIRNAVTVSTGITGVTVRNFDIDRVSDTEVTVELTFDGTDFDTNSTITFTVGAGAIADYDGTDLTSQVSVPAVAESVVASTATPLTEATLDESVVTLTLNGRTFERSSSRVRGAVSVSGISGVTVGTFDIDRVSDTQVTVELMFDGTDFDTTSTLTFTVGPGAIAGYDGPALTAQVPVSATTEAPTVTDPQPPQQPDITDSRVTFESSTPAGYTRVTLRNTGTVWGVPTQYTTDSDAGTVAYMLLATLKGCSFADAEVARQSKVYIKTQVLGSLSNFESETVCSKTSRTWTTSWNGVRITHLRFFEESSTPNIKEAVYNDTTGQIEIPGESVPTPTTTPTPTNNTPTFTAGSRTTRTIAENTAAGRNIGSPVSATDADNDTLSHTLSGTDANAFSIDSTTGQLKTKSALDYETKTAYTVTVTVSDGSLTDTITVTINVTDVAETPTAQQPGGGGETPTLSASTASPLTEATLHEGVVTLRLSGGTYESSSSRIRNAVTVSTGITGVTVRSFDIDRVSDTEVTVELTFDGTDFDTNSTITFTVGAGAIADYDGTALTSQVAVTASTESVVASTASPLTEDTLDGSVVTLTLSGRTYESSGVRIRNAVTVSGISGVTVGTFDIDRVNDTQVTVELTFDSTNFDTNSTLAFTVGPGAIADYDGPALTAQVSVSATTETPGGNVGGTPTLRASTGAPLAEATLDESVVTLTLSDGTYESSSSRIRNAVTVSTGITGVTVKSFDIDRVSNTQITVELTFDGTDFDTNSTLTFTVGARAIADYDGTALTTQIPVSANTESVVTTTAAPLTEDTLDGSVVTLTLSGRNYESSGVRIRNAVTVSGISGITVGTFDIDRESDTEVTVELTFDGNIDTDSTLTFTVGEGAIANYDGTALTTQVSVSASTEAPVVTDGQTPVTPQQLVTPEQPQQPENTGGTPTLSVTTAAPLTEATLHEGVVTLRLSGGTYERSSFSIRNAVTVSGIAGVTVGTFGVDRVSDTEVTIELEFDGNINTNATLIFTVGAAAIVDYTGPALTAQIPVTANTESVVATTVSPLTEATLDESVVTLALNGANYERSIFDIRGAVTVSAGITGVTVGTFGVRRVSDTEVTVELEFDGTDFDTTSTLTFTVGAEAIAGYNGPALTTQISVTAVAESVVASTAAPLTEDTLDGSVVTLTLSGRSYERSRFTIGDALTISGIDGVTVGTFGVDRVSDTKITVELTFNGNIDTDATLTFTVGSDAIAGYNGPALTAQVFVTATVQVLRAPSGISLMHVPLQVTAVDGVAQTIESVGDLYNALGGMNTVNLLITHNPKTQEWHSYLGEASRGTSADTVLTDNQGIIADMKTPVSLQLDGNALGRNGSSVITLRPGTNLVAMPLSDSRITHVSDLLALEGIGGNVSAITVSNNGTFQTVKQAGNAGDIPITGGQSFILNARETATVAISGQGWDHVSGAAATAPMKLMGIEVGDTTPILALTGSIVSPVGEWGRMPHLRSGSGFRVIVKNLSTGRAVATMIGNEGNRYQLTIVDTATGRAAQIGDILEISVRSLDPRISVHPLRHTVTPEDVKWSRVEFGNLIAYEIPTETALLPNYPNPFNPETWIPYRLAEDAFVTLTIYDGNGQVVRTLEIGHRVAAIYESRSKAIYWDGRNEFGEQVASGVYFYHLSAGDFSATRKMLILK